MSEKSRLTRLMLVSPMMSTREEPLVLVPTVDYDAELDAYFVTGGGEIKQLPANHHTCELLEVDPNDRIALLEFQRMWGLLASPHRVPLRANASRVPSMAMATPRIDMSDDKALEDAQQLYHALCIRHADFKRSSPLLTILRGPGYYGTYTFVPGGEAEAAVKELQTSTSMLVYAHTTGYDDWEGIETRELSGLVAELSGAVEPYYPRYCVAEKDADGRDAPAPVLPTSVAILAQLLAYLASDEGYRVCKQCGRLFLYKRHKVGEFTRNRRSLYCSDTCKEKASWSAQAARRKAARHAQEDGQ